MNPKSGIWTTEHLAAVVSQVLTMLALFGFISQNDTQTLEEAITKGVAAVFIFSANAAVVVQYIRSRLHLKAGANSNGVSDKSETGKVVTGGLVLLAVLTIFSGPAQAQYVLPFRNNHEQRLKALEQQLAAQQKQVPQPLIIQVPSQPAPAAPAPAGPQIIYQPYPVQPPLQSFPIHGQPLQTFPIQGQPLQTFPIQGQPQQAFPIQGQPQQALPIQGQPRQVFPISPSPQAQPQQPAPAPAPARPQPSPAPQEQPKQTFPIAPSRPAPAPAPAPNATPTGPTPYTTRIVRALYRP